MGRLDVGAQDRNWGGREKSWSRRRSRTQNGAEGEADGRELNPGQQFKSLIV